MTTTCAPSGHLIQKPPLGAAYKPQQRCKPPTLPAVPGAFLATGCWPVAGESASETCWRSATLTWAWTWCRAKGPNGQLDSPSPECPLAVYLGRAGQGNTSPCVPATHVRGLQLVTCPAAASPLRSALLTAARFSPSICVSLIFVPLAFVCCANTRPAKPHQISYRENIAGVCVTQPASMSVFE